ncbi:ABC-type metal ion transport system, periplasmic component/surface adhesin [Leptolyngbyaceae cyanobacterium JSC-12]|nr:ABC-type metal ion transport system, periplasmic component/surface adhesin [Leptolyngbyaceae cyanobacterium JSC-12]
MHSMVHRVWRGTVLAFAVGLLTSCASSTPTTQEPAASNTSSPATAANAPKVVATTTILCDMVREIAQNTVDLTCLLKPGVDGHVYQPVPDDRRAIEDAKLILYSGYDFEPGLIKLIQSTSNPAPKVAVAEKAVPKPLMGHEHGEEHANEKTEAHDHDHAHDHAAGAETPDPHVWQSAENGARMVAVVQDALIKLAPENKELYSKNGEALETQLSEIHTWIKSQIATVPKSHRKLVTTHDAMKYFSEAYNIPVEGALQGLSTDEKPTATRVKELVDAVKASGVPTIFAEVVVNPKLIEAVARDANVKVADRELYSDSLGEPGSEGDTYPKMLIANTRTIIEGLHGKYVAFKSNKSQLN